MRLSFGVTFPLSLMLREKVGSAGLFVYSGRMPAWLSKPTG